MKSYVRQPRGIRNNNPGNIRRSADPWQGLAENQSDIEFFTFKNPVYGIRAIARLLISYQDKYKLRTIRQIISRWAPPKENNTESYIQSVASRTRFHPDQPLDMHAYNHLRPLVEAIVIHENRQQPYTDAQIIKGLVLAGVEPAEKPLSQSRTVKAGRVATGATLGTIVIGAVQENIDYARDALLSVAPYLEIGKWLLLSCTLIGIGTMLWARIDDHRKGLR